MSGTATSTICVDASLVIPRVVPGPLTARVLGLFESWIDAGARLVAPTLLGYECANVLHRLSTAGRIAPGAADEALRVLIGMPVTPIDGDSLHRSALELSRQLGFAATYDAHYLAAARAASAELWTCDRRLTERCRTLGWVHLVE